MSHMYNVVNGKVGLLGGDRTFYSQKSAAISQALRSIIRHRYCLTILILFTFEDVGVHLY